jgi:hypothetical protein
MSATTPSRALWNRSTLDLRSNEILAQILERGDLESWRMLYARARGDRTLCARLESIVLTVPLPLPRFWLAALVSLGADVDLGAKVPDYFSGTTI